MTHIHDGLQARNLRSWVELPRPLPHESHLVIADGRDLLELCKWAAEQHYYLCTMTACDERMLEEHVFKLYIVLSSPDGELVVLEHPLAPNSVEYVSVREAFPSVQVLEQATRDLLGLTPVNAWLEERFWLHTPYPRTLFPLRRNRTIERLRGLIANHQPVSETFAALPAGVLNLIVGPIHAGVIEAGQFRFHIAGDVIEDLEIKLGYKHRGIEKLFETHYLLHNGQELAERISGDSAFVHGLAYCHAVESLTNQTLPEAALYWRGLLLEMERLYNHIGDVGALVHDIAFDLVASEIAVMRERMLRFNDMLTGSRLLRGATHPGGVHIVSPDRLPEICTDIRQVAFAFLDLVSKHVIANSICRNRFLTTGLLTEAEAKMMGATGLTARASGLWQQDFRLRQPRGVYALAGIGADLRERITATHNDSVDVSRFREPSRQMPLFRSDLGGDAFARLLVRVAEVETSVQIVERLANELQILGAKAPTSLGSDFWRALDQVDNFEIGLGYAEGWRGEVFYFVMKGPNRTIFRCQPRDPSLFNWPALRLAVIRKPKSQARGRTRSRKHDFAENILADFPIINKSFNLSYAGCDG